MHGTTQKRQIACPSLLRLAWSLVTGLICLYATPLGRGQEVGASDSNSIFRIGFSSATVDEISKMHESQQGRQIFTVFKVDRLEEPPLTCLDSARDLLAAYRRLCGGTNSTQTGGFVLLPGKGERKGQR